MYNLCRALCRGWASVEGRERIVRWSNSFIITNFSQSSQLFSTVSFTRFVYSLRLSLYRFEASTLAGEEVLGSLRRLGKKKKTKGSQHGTRSDG